MESSIDKKELISTIADENATKGDSTTAILVMALVEIREAIEDGIARLDQTQLEASMMLIGAKESFDQYMKHRLEADKVLAGVSAAIMASREEKEQKTEPEAEQREKAAVTLNAGSHGCPVSESGIC